MKDFKAKIVLCENTEDFFGPGVRDLFLFIESEHSVKAASEKMGMSYSKAWKLIRNVEKTLGKPAITRTQGGRDGGSASLTAEGKDLLERYIAFEAESLEAVGKIFNRSFPSGR